MRLAPLNAENRGLILDFLVEHSGGLLDPAHVADRLDNLIASPEHALAVGQPLVGAATLIDTCDNSTDAAELTLFATDEAVIPRLLAWGEGLARRGPRGAIELPRWPRHSASSEQLQAAGYGPSYSMFTMVRTEEPIPDSRPLPSPFVWVDLTESRIEAYYATLREAFAELPGAYIPDLPRFRERARRLPVRLILHQERVAAFLRVERVGDTGHIHSLGRHPDFRGAGLGEAILDEALSLLSGAPRLELEVAARNQRALALYQRRGFQVEGRQDMWSKRL